MRKTKLTGGIIPEDSLYGKKSEEQIKKLASDMSKGWHIHELEMTKKLLRINDKQLGLKMAELDFKYQECIEILNQSIVYSHHCTNLEKNQDNYIDFFEENQYGKIDKVNSLDNIKGRLNKDIIIGWLSKNISYNTLLLVMKELEYEE